MDKKIWNHAKDYFIEQSDFDINNKTQLSPGAELTVYNETTHYTVDTCFCTPNGVWVSYKSGN